ncbi:MAG TPA: cytidine deaminase [Terracidiphilus sp.]|nr:cytidine deaminase [Terracidiphilus sp.]
MTQAGTHAGTRAGAREGRPLDTAMAELVKLAEEVAKNSYSKESKFRVGAALRLSNGKVVAGTNVENRSYGLTICAERAAIVRAVAECGPEIRVVAAAIVNLNGADSSPCGACRQVLTEFTEPDAPVAFPWNGQMEVQPFSALAPFPFGAKEKRGA